MPAPFPYEFVPGRRDLAQQCSEIFADYGWMARWSDEILADARLNLKKLFQLWGHCARFRASLGQFIPVQKQEEPIAVALTDFFSSKGVKWADEALMIADLEALHAGASALFDTIDAAFPAPKVFAQRALDAQGNEIEVTVEVDKETAQIVADAVATFRNSYGEKPALKA